MSDDAQATHTAVLEKVKAPAICMIAFGVIGFALSLANLFGAFFGAGLNEWVMQRLEQEGEQIPEFFRFLSGPGSLALSLLQIAVETAISGFVLYAGMRLQKLRDRGICMAAAIIAMVPCINPCCCLGIPLGIWVLMVLNRPDVRSSFQSSN